MKIIYKEGDIFKGPEYYLAHGCNAKGVMGSGIAKAVRELYPKAYHDYKAEHLDKGLRLGDVVVSANPDRTIFNCITQEGYGRDPNVRYVDYAAVAMVVKFINRYITMDIVYNLIPAEIPVAFPMIGAGLGNGDWDRISNIIEENSHNFQPIVYKYKDIDVNLSKQ